MTRRVTPDAPVTSPLLRIATAGSVDDGKSTLIGRLLLDTDSITDDHLDALKTSSERRGHVQTNLALLTDGLRAEREEGITIDVAYRYFSTDNRSFILADTPGHQQYTRNMVTGTSDADVAIVLIDARNGLVEQSRRHAFIAAMLGVGNIVLAVNKMDLVGWDKTIFTRIADEFTNYINQLTTNPPVIPIPISALHGDNIVTASESSGWYEGPTLLNLLETLPHVEPHGRTTARLAVQWVIRPIDDAHHDFRGYAGRLHGEALSVGDEIVVLPSGQASRVASIETPAGATNTAEPGQAISVQLEDHLDVGRGDVIAGRAGNQPTVTTQVHADICWMAKRPLTPGSRWLIKHATRSARAIVDGIEHRYNVHSLDPEPSVELVLNDLARVQLRVSTPLAVDTYDQSKSTGSFILLDEATNATVAAGMIRAAN